MVVNGDRKRPGQTLLMGLFGLAALPVLLGAVDVNATYYHYLDSEEFLSDRDWINFSFEYRF